MKNILFRHIILLVVTNCLFTPLYAQFTFLQSFKGNVLPSNIIVGGSPSSAYLTSGNGDAANDGWLRLTNSNLNQKGFAYINSAFPSSLGILIDFQYTAWRDYGSDVGADGIGVFLFDAASTSTFALGGWGGSLGYAPNTTLGTTTGLTGGYIGIGLDEYGNFSNPTEGRVGGPGKQCNSITLRGPTTSNPSTTNPYLTSYQLQTSNTSNTNSIDYNTVTSTRPTDAQFYRRVKISIIPIGTVMVPKFRITASWLLSPGGIDVPLFTYDTNTPPPTLLKLGFAASTSGSYNYHEIRNLIVTTPGGFRVDESVDKVSASVNDQLTYTVNVYNATAGPVTNLRLSDVIKDGLGNNVDISSSGNFTVNSITFNDNSNPNNTATGFPNGVNITQGLTNPFTSTLNMDGNTISTFTIVGTIKKLPAGGGVLTNSVTIDPSLTGIADNDATNNNFSLSTNVLNCDFVINNTVNNSCADPTNGNSYTLLVSNNGTINSTTGKTVTVTDNIPTGFTVTSTNATGWSVSHVGNVYTFKRTTGLAVGASYPPIVISFKAPSTGTSWVNSAVVDYSGIEATETNNSSSVTLYAAPTAPAVSTPVSYWQGNTPVALTASGTNLMWYTTLGGAGSTTAPVPGTATPGSKTYYVTQNNGYCESKPSAIVVIVNPLPTATISGTTIVSQNDVVTPNITFTGSGGTAPYTFTYTVNGGSPQTVTTTSGNSVAVSQAITAPGSFVYSLVSVKDASSPACSNAQTGASTITVNPLPTATISSTTTQNYILTKTYLEADASRSVDIIQYFDGLGRPSQTVQRAITPTGADLVTGTMYDSFGRDSLQWLPAVAGGNNGAYDPNFATQAVSSNGDTKPYSRTEYEPSPLNRVTEQYGAGADWYNAGKKQTINYQTNDGSILYFYVNSDSQLSKGTNYAANMLYVTQTTDEDGKTGYEFKDKQGRVILKRQTCNSSNVDTYYVYNDLGQLCYVLPPKAVDEVTSDLSDGNAIIKQYCYLYQYDERGNCKYKRLPGCEPIYMVYDRADRLVLSQDGNQRSKAQWTATKYDVLGRLIFTGTTNAIPNTTALGDLISTYKDKLIVESYTNGSGYACTNFCDASPLTINYYDSYDFTTFITNGSNFSWGTPPSGYNVQYMDNTGQPNAKGLLTGTLVYRLNDPTKYEATALYYNDRGQVVQTRASNHLDGSDLTYNALDFRGKVLRTRKEHNIFSQAVIPEVYRYAYDKAERLLMTRYKLGTNDTITLAANTYDEQGRLSTKNLGGMDATTYSYNVRGWTTVINGSKFTENLYYNVNTANVPVFTPCYNGNIAGMQWSVPSESLGYNRAYTFGYDGLNRLTDANYCGFNGSAVAGTTGKYDEHMGFDKMGNFNTLTRNENGTPLNNLSFAYVGNQMKKVDNSISPTPFIPYGSEAFNDKRQIDTEYKYDKNGNITYDTNNGISTIQYNILNLPDQIQFTEGHKNLYTYDASGKKLEAVNYTVSDIVNVPMDTITVLPSPSRYTKLTTDYVGNMIYENGSLKEILLPEGYYKRGIYYYYLKDHLGDTRVVINSSGSVIEKSHYYPSGMRFFPESTSDSSALAYRYNGKEMEAMNGLNQYDYGARRRGTGLPVWAAVDPLCEKYYNISPYVYCAGNPMNRIDPNGMDYYITVQRDKNNDIVGITFHAKVYITGKGAKKREASLNNLAKETFKSKSVNNVSVNFDVNYEYRDKMESSELNSKKGENLLTFTDNPSATRKDGSKDSFIENDDVPNAAYYHGEIYTEKDDNIINYDVMHETMHALGFDDRYNDKYKPDAGYKYDVMGRSGQLGIVYSHYQSMYNHAMNSQQVKLDSYNPLIYGRVFSPLQYNSKYTNLITDENVMIDKR